MRAKRGDVAAALCALLLTTAVACSSAPPGNPQRISAPTGPPAAVCDTQLAGPTSPPARAVTVDPAVDGDLYVKSMASPPGTAFWLAPGRHTLGVNEYGQVIPKDGDTYLGAPGAILDGRGINRYAFTQHAKDVTIRYLTVQGFTAQQNEGVVNHDSADGWVIEHNTIQDNRGAGLMAGARQKVRYNCLRDNGQYGINAYKSGDAISGLLVENNEIAWNNTDDWERRVPGCGCTAGVKFWAVNGADVRANWIHDNHGAGLWADTNNNDFLIEGNLIENNDAEAVFYEISYNLILRGNMLRHNTWVKGKQFADRKDTFPVAALYLSESGGEPRIPARTDMIEVYDNVFENNWSGITAWENADRFCNSQGNTCNRLVPSKQECSQPGIATKPLYDDCRWKTQRVDVHDNQFTFVPASVGCAIGASPRMAMLANYGTYPSWSPYKGMRIQQAVTFQQDNRWHDNAYRGPWTFTAFDTGRSPNVAEWQAEPYRQDMGSTFSNNPPTSGC